MLKKVVNVCMLIKLKSTYLIQSGLRIFAVWVLISKNFAKNQQIQEKPFSLLTTLSKNLSKISQ